MSDNNRNQDVDLLTLVDELPKEMAPKRDLWPGIEQAIASKPQIQQASNNSNWHNWARTAAAFVPAAFVLMFWLQQSSVNEPSEQFNSVVAGFEVQKRQLLRQVASDTPVVTNWEALLADLEQAEQALLKALQSQPEDPTLLKMLTHVYQQQLELIQKSHQSAQPQFTQI